MALLVKAVDTAEAPLYKVRDQVRQTSNKASYKQ
jgi:hypothetical protein